jgi:hypothetical protein
MFRVFSPFTASGRFALLLALNLIASGGASAQDMRDRDHQRPGPTLVSPADGATVDHQFTVRIGFAGFAGPRGPAEGTGITLGPPPPPEGAPPPRGAHDGPDEGTGLALGAEHRPRGPHFVLLVDAPALDEGVPFKPDAQHIPFPAGIPQMTLSLPPGPHNLILQTLDHDGSVSLRHPPAVIAVTVKE